MVEKTIKCMSLRLLWQELQPVLWNLSSPLHLNLLNFVRKCLQRLGFQLLLLLQKEYPFHLCLQDCYPDMRALNHSVGLLSTLTTKHPNMVDAQKDYPWMMTGSGRPPSVCDVRRPLDIISLEGWAALWRGLRSRVVRDSIFGGIFFASWQCLHQAMLAWKAVNMDPPPRYDKEIGPLSPLAVSLAAGFSGSIAAAASHGFDTARSRSQCIVLPKYVAMERKLLKWNRPGKRFERLTGIHPADRNIQFRGIWPGWLVVESHHSLL